MPKFKFLIILVVMFSAIRGCSSYRAQVSLVDIGVQHQISLAKILNDVVPILAIVVILTVIYLIIWGLKSLREKEKAKPISQSRLGDVENNAGVEGQLQRVESTNERNVIGWYLFSAAIIGGLFGGGGGYMLANFTLGLNESMSELVGWGAAIVLGVISFIRKWELF